MRVTGGILRGRAMEVPKTEVRPTQDKVRAALFSALAAKIPGARVLDLFAGSGAMGIEAWSRGAAYVCWVERSPRVFAVLHRNVGALCRGGEAQVLVLCDDAVDAIRQGKVGGSFDLITADPPYDRGNRWGWFEKTLQAVAQSHMLAPQGVLAYEMSADEGWGPPPEPWVVVRDKRYGGTRLLFLMQQRGAP
jgi:16S rRNA (guanine966-N2)-methyltransferase